MMGSESRQGSGWTQVTIVAAAVFLIGLVFLWPYLGGPQEKVSPAAGAEAQPAAVLSVDPARDALIRSAVEAAEAGVNRRWEVILERARAAAAEGPDGLSLFVWTLFTAFDALDLQAQEDALRAFFETGQDVALGERFTVGPGGWLTGWPTLRVALYDYVAQRRPELARELATELLRTRPEEPGEWALAFRELVRGKPAAEWSDLVRVRLKEFIHDPTWAAEDAPGWAEGFDVLVAHGTPEPLPDLSRMSAGDASRAARFAAFLTADRLVMAAPAACLQALNADPGLFSGATGVRAGLFARADIRDPEQAAALETYLARDDIGPGERAQFAASFPQLSAPPTFRLLTEPVVRPPEEVHAAEAHVLETLGAWIAAGRFPSWSDTFAEIRQRLKSRQAANGGT